jgi:hypothetical protein
MAKITDAMGEGFEQLAAQAPARRRRPPKKLQRLLCSWRQTAPVSFTAPSSRWTEGAPRSDGYQARIAAYLAGGHPLLNHKNCLDSKELRGQGGAV